MERWTEGFDEEGVKNAKEAPRVLATHQPPNSPKPNLAQRNHPHQTPFPNHYLHVPPPGLGRQVKGPRRRPARGDGQVAPDARPLLLVVAAVFDLVLGGGLIDWDMAGRHRAEVDGPPQYPPTPVHVHTPHRILFIKTKQNKTN